MPEKISKIRSELSNLTRFPSVPSNKTSAGFQKGGLPMRILKPPVPLPTPIKCKVKTIGPLEFWNVILFKLSCG